MKKPSIDHKVFVFDGDIIGYKVAWATQTEIDWGDGENTCYNLEEACTAATVYINNIMKELRHPDFQGTEHIIIALSDGEGKNFRKDLNPEYKAQRKATKKPVVFKEVIKFLKDKYHTMEVDYLEADDVMGIMGTKEHPESTEVTIISIDKDMKTVPCIFYSSDKKELHHISELEADYNFCMQTLTGDTVDNYKGIPGIGPKKAEKIVDPNGEAFLAADKFKYMWTNVKQAYLNAGMSEEDALMNGRMARILRANDYEIDKEGNLILWQPPNWEQEKGLTWEKWKSM